MKFIKKPVIIDAIQYVDDRPDTLREIQRFMNGDVAISYKDPASPKLLIPTLEGTMQASIGDYIIKGVRGEFYPCKPEIFLETYDPA